MALFSALWFYASTCLAILLYFTDILSDVVLSFEYFLNGDYYWGAFTIGLVIQPWVLFVLFALFRYHMGHQSTMCGGVLFFFPPLYSITAIKQKWRGEEEAAKATIHKRNYVNNIEIIGEALPQLGL